MHTSSTALSVMYAFEPRLEKHDFTFLCVSFHQLCMYCCLSVFLAMAEHVNTLQAHHAEGYKWWAQRLGRSFQLYDETRIDHFRGFAGELHDCF